MSIVKRNCAERASVPSTPLQGVGTLGTYAKSHSAPAEARATRWMRKAFVDQLLPRSRTWKCHKWSIPQGQIRAMHSAEFQRAFYAGLEVCASVWACPLCRAKIAERRRAELVAGIELAKAMGYRVLLLTQTIPHGIGDDLDKLLVQLKRAQKGFTSDRRALAWRKSLGLVGTVRSFEVTYGQHGWHPHFHTLLILPKDGPSIEQIQAEASAIWCEVAVRVGLPPPHPLHGVNVQDGKAAAAYVSKWGLAEEMTKSASKAARAGGRSPDQLIDDYAAGDKQAGALYAAYAKAFKGQRALVWSRGLKKLLAVQEVSDHELATASEDESAAIFARISAVAWGLLIKRRQQAVLLDLIERDRHAANRFLSEIEAQASHVTGGVTRLRIQQASLVTSHVTLTSPEKEATHAAEQRDPTVGRGDRHGG